MSIDIEFPRKLRYLFEPHPYKIAYGGRGGAKSWGFAIALLELGAMRPLRILCARETMKSLADSVHKLLGDQIARLGFGDKYTILDNEIRGKNGTEIIFAGLKHNIDNIKSLESADIVWVEEAQTVSKNSWSKLIPTIRKEGAELWVSFNPGLATDDTYKRFVLKPPKNAVVQKIGWEDNRWLSERARNDIDDLLDRDPDEFAHIYGGECRSNIEGAIFGAEMKAALAQGRIGSVPYNKMRPVSTVWDLGFGDPTAIWFVQAYDGYYNFIDFLESSDETTADYVIKLQNRGYAYDTDWLPHDSIDTIIHRKLSGTTDRTKSIEMLLREARRHVRVVPKLLLTDQINAARLFLNQCRFDEEKCADGLQSLRHYQWAMRAEQDTDKRPATNVQEEREVRTNKPLHNWASHAASAFMGASIAMKQPKREEEKKPQGIVRPPALPGAYSPFG